MGGTITLAGSSLESTYHKMFDTILSSSAGTVLTNIGLAAAVLLALGLIAGAICKALGRQNKVVQMFCPKDGIVLDAFGGSGTTGHATLSVNSQDNGSRKFILIERGDYCNSITAERIRRVISGKWASPKSDTKPLPGSFVFVRAEDTGAA